MKIHQEYIAERISDDRFSDFIEIHKDAFKSKLSSEFQKKKFDTISVAGVENLGYVAYHMNGEPAAFYGVYPLYAYLNKKKVLVSQSGDTMTKPAHVGRGLFIDLAAATYELCKTNMVNGVFGFPSKASHPGFKKKLNWTFSEKIKRYLFLVPTLPVSILSEKLPFLRKAYHIWVRFILSFYKKGNYFKGSVFENGQDCVLRDEHFWKYKMNSDSIHIIKIKNTNVVIKFNGKVSVGDIDLKKEEDILPIMGKLKLLAFLTFNTHVVFYVSPNTVLDEKLAQIATATDALPSGFLNFNNDNDLSKLKFTYLDFDTF